MKHQGWRRRRRRRRRGEEAMGREGVALAERCRCRVASNNTNLRRWERRRRRVCQQTATSRKGEQKAQLPSPIPTVSSNPGPVRFLPAEKPRWSMDHKYEAGGKGVVHFHGIFCQHNIMIGIGEVGAVLNTWGSFSNAAGLQGDCPLVKGTVVTHQRHSATDGEVITRTICRS